MGLFRQNIRYLFILVFPAICVLFYNTLFNVHSHQLKSGVVTHAHHYTKNTESTTPSQNHKHSSSEIVLLDKIFYFFFFIILGTLLISIISHLNKKSIVVIPIYKTCNTYYHSNNSRAPPIQF